MLHVALKMLIGDRLKYLALVGGVAFASLLITQQAAIFAGFDRQSGSWIRGVGGIDLWVTDPEVEFSDDIKPMRDTDLLRVRGIQGVAWAVPMFKDFLSARLPDGTRTMIKLVGLDDASLTGGPLHLLDGATLADLKQDRAVIINTGDLKGDLRLKRSPGEQLEAGDHISINDHDAHIVGKYYAKKEFFWGPTIYTTYSRAIAWAPPERRMLSFILAKLQPGADPDEVARRIEETTELKARTTAQFDRETSDWVMVNTGILANFGITIGLGFVIGLLVAGQTFFSFVLDNLRHFAALKAMGTTNGRIFMMLTLQVVIVGLVGYGIGIGAASVFGSVLGNAGGLAFAMPWVIPVAGGVGVMFCCLVAGLIGVVKVIRLEPAVVFK